MSRLATTGLQGRMLDLVLSEQQKRKYISWNEFERNKEFTL